MLEPCVNQACGLQSLALQRHPRLLAMASHGRQQGELPLLWGLCARWVDLGLSVLVLDAHVPESSSNPGLAQLRADPLQHASDAGLSWQVLPAADGLRGLSASQLLDSQLSNAFKVYDVVLIYGAAETLCSLLQGSRVAPLLVLAPAPDAALSAYAALKRLVTHGQLQPIVANIVPDSAAVPRQWLTASAALLQQCATSFLGYQLMPHTVVASPRANDAQDGLQRLALQMFENAMPLQASGFERLH